MGQMLGSGWYRLIARFMPLLLLPLVAGCGPGQGKVSGRVLYEGKPLPGGRLTFIPADTTQNSVTTVLDEQGNYQAVVPAGEVKVSVDNRELKPREPLPMGVPPGIPGGVAAKLAEARRQNPPKAAGTIDPGMRGRIPGKYVPIPEKYHDISTSPLKFTVQRGDQTHDIELTK